MAKPTGTRSRDRIGMSKNHSLRDLHQRPGFLLKRCHQVAAAIFLEECKDAKMTPSQYGALRVLAVYPGIDQIALGRLAGLDRSTAGLVIKLLLQRGLIERAVNPNDKRRMNLRLSVEGEHLLAAMAPAAQRAQEKVLNVLPRESRSLFVGLLQDFLAGHDAEIDAENIVAGTVVPTDRP
jgi:DNA-binding MarR family transcriptional regulator